MRGNLRILQYNANKSKDKVLIGLLQDSRTAEYDIIAIQEPYRNPYDSAAYNPHNSPFHLIDYKKAGSRVNTYVNKKLPLRTFHSKDLLSITLHIAGEPLETRVINIHNVCNPPPETTTKRRNSARSQSYLRRWKCPMSTSS